MLTQYVPIFIVIFITDEYVYTTLNFVKSWSQEELKEVFEGSCALIPVKVVANYCKKLADEFIPELVETLASEMNPDTVCTVAGKCFSHWNRH